MGKREPAKRDAERTVGASIAARSPIGRAPRTLVAVIVLGVSLAVGMSVLAPPHAAAAVSTGPATVSAAAAAAPSSTVPSSTVTAPPSPIDPASTEPAPAPTPSDPSPQPDAPEPVAPTITSPADGSAVTSARTTVSGTKSAGAGVIVETGGGTVLCTVNAGRATSFSCSGIAVPAGGAVVLRATGTGADGSPDGSGSSITVTSVPPPTVATSGASPVNGLVRGTGIPGARVTVTASSGESCGLTADSGGAWACLLTGSAPDGAYRLTATQEARFAPGVRSDPSGSVRIMLDRTAPVAPVVGAPADGSTLPAGEVEFSGTGENGATVTVFVGSASVCQAIVSSGRWSCVAAVAAGRARIVAVQRDVASNSSPGSNAVGVVLGTRTTPPAPTPTPSSPAPTPTPAPSDGVTPAPGATDTPSDGSDPGAPLAPLAPPAPGAGPGAPPSPDAWDATTPFSAPLSPLLASGTAADVTRAVVLAALVSSSIALGALLLLRGAPAAERAGATRRIVLAGRNRQEIAVTRTAAPAGSSSTSGTTVVFALLAVAALLILSRPVDGTPAYARLLFAAVTATAVIALVSVVVPAMVARWLGGGRLHTTVDPRGFLIVAGAAAASRLVDLDPPVLFALVVTASTAAAVGRATEGRIALARIAGLAVLGVLAGATGMLLSPALQPGFASSLVIETLNVLTAAALGSATIMLIPLGTSTGRALWASSRLGWLALAIVVVALEIALLGSRSTESADAVAALGTIGVVACATLVLSVWIWRRFVTPELTREN